MKEKIKTCTKTPKLQKSFNTIFKNQRRVSLSLFHRYFFCFLFQTIYLFLFFSIWEVLHVTKADEGGT